MRVAICLHASDHAFCHRRDVFNGANGVGASISMGCTLVDELGRFTISCHRVTDHITWTGHDFDVRSAVVKVARHPEWHPSEVWCPLTRIDCERARLFRWVHLRDTALAHIKPDGLDVFPSFWQWPLREIVGHAHIDDLVLHIHVHKVD
jgi:hypothetical protein